MSQVYTIGYEGSDIERFVATLRAVGVTMLVDVRAVAVSRKKGFSKSRLRERLDAERISYVHLVNLGDPKVGREAARGGNYRKFRQVYAAHLKTADAVCALSVLDEAARRDIVCLMCFERDPAVCHRRIIADRLKARGFEVLDLFGDEPSSYVSHTNKVSRRHPHQGDAESQPEAW
jgi:uncharacterized protein (DUF488 family)